jgi:hypothetical protein
MIAKTFLSLICVALTASVSIAATEGVDTANDLAYDGNGWTDGDDAERQTPSSWSLLVSGTGSRGFIIESSTNGGADINTGGEAFGIFAAGANNYADAYRSFVTPLASGQMFSIQLSVNFTGGTRGFNLLDGSTKSSTSTSDRATTTR